MMRTKSIYLATLQLLLLTVAVHAQGMPNLRRFGFDGFRLLLQQNNMATLQTSTDETFGDPQDTAVVLLGDLSQATALFEQLEMFVLEGGAALVASDLGTTKALMGLELKRGPKAVGTNWAYRGLRDCAVIRVLDPETDSIRSHLEFQAMMNGVQTVITNKPGYLRVVNPSSPMQICSWLPTGSRRYPLIAAYRNNAGGRLVLSGDHSLFINEMLMHGDNAKLASNIATMLCEGRSNLVFIEDGLVLPAWSLGETTEPIPLAELIAEAERNGLLNLLPKNSIVPFANTAVAEFEDTDGFNRYLTHPFYRLSSRSVWRGVSVVTMLLFVFCFLRWLVMTPNRLMRWFQAKLLPRYNEPRATAGVVNGQYGPCIRLLAREFFSATGGSVWRQDAAPFVAEGIEARKRRRQVERLWKIASSTRSPQLGKKRFKRLVDTMSELRQLQNKGELRLEWQDSGT